MEIVLCIIVLSILFVHHCIVNTLMCPVRLAQMIKKAQSKVPSDWSRHLRLEEVRIDDQLLRNQLLMRLPRQRRTIQSVDATSVWRVHAVAVRPLRCRHSGLGPGLQPGADDSTTDQTPPVLVRGAQ